MRRLSLPVLALALVALNAPRPAAAADLIGFWDAPRHGGNSFNRLPPDAAYFAALRGYGASWVRLSYDKWKPGGRDFLIGDADDYQRLAPADLKTLKAALARADAAGLKTVVAPLSLPYSRWAQNNGGRFDDRLWQDREHWEAAARFWRDLARELKDQPGIAAYNLINEPAPEKQAGLSEYASAQQRRDWYAAQRGGARDLPAFYQRIVQAIREVDPDTPIMLDAGWYASAGGFDYWPAPLADAKTLYSVHMYEPYQVTSAPNLKRAKPYVYPGPAPYGDGEQTWNRERVAAHLAQAFDWAKTHEVPATRLVAGEFGCVRQLNDCARYLDDVLAALDRAGAHWAFYAFREDAWDAMDYELGKGKVDWRYWEAMEQGKPDPVPRKATPVFEPIRKRLSAGRE
ncbi:glycoside hydrolase family 5 protein [Lysobacter enzymogenes]|uniref:glycoside hydrolase family 5 protein n=1 Tax=Lysobacter enzymogenes TaxID=69 RepID=UPI000897C0D6|nr:cellulase family glycosylhydrolase [Lysobacter enzymogenes]SDX43095.1 Cellulase (glycosyl hydrolase family 5) [Lysobacter enzymogenes]